MGNRYLSTFLIFLLFRLSSVYFIKTFFVPDEYWQSLEVAHKMTFGYGYLTWEWQHGLRSYLHPAIFFVLYKILYCLSLDYPLFLITLPKILQATLTAVSDQYFFLLCKYFKFQSHWINVAIFTNWFWYYCGMRTIVNSFETCLTIMALYYYPWELFRRKAKGSGKSQIDMWPDINSKSVKYLTLASLNCLVRPTALTIWAPMTLMQWITLQPNLQKKFILNCILPSCVLTIPFSTLIDCICYGKLTFPAFNFLLFNVFKGVSSHYGTHPFHWYFSQGIPVVLGLQYVPFLISLVFFFLNRSRETENQNKSAFGVLLFVAALNLIVLSIIPHKEFRFLLPIMPLMMLIAIKFESEFFIKKKLIKYIWTLILAGGFVIPSIIFGIHHQRGALQLINYLRSEGEQCGKNCSFLFLMPCHSTPMYSHLHINVTTRFLECEPPIDDSHFDESDLFFENPIAWLNDYWKNNKPPTHIALFDDINEQVETFFFNKNYAKKVEILHTKLTRPNARRYIYVYEIG